MKKTLVILGLIALFAVTVISISEGITKTYTFESITVATTAIGFTAGDIAFSSAPDLRVFCTVETAQIRFRTDGTNPTSAEGHILNVGDTVTITGLKDAENFRAIRTGGTSGVLKCSYAN